MCRQWEQDVCFASYMILPGQNRGQELRGVAHSSAGKEKGLFDFQEIPGMKKIETVCA